MLGANEIAQIQSLTDRDIRSTCRWATSVPRSFHARTRNDPLGEAAADLVANRLASLAVPEQDYAAWRARVTTRQAVETRIADVRVEGLKRVNPDYLRAFTTIHPGDTVDIATISADAARMSALDDIESVAYRFEGDPGNPTLVWLPVEASIGPDVLRPSLGMYAAGGGNLSFELSVQHVRHWLNPRGGRWRNNVQVGYETLLTSSLYQPFDVAQRYFVEPAVFAIRSSRGSLQRRRPDCHVPVH